MAKDFDLTSQEWLDLVFDNKNKAYGAYELREDSSNRHLKALFIVALVGLAFVYLPAIIKQAIPEKSKVVEVPTEHNFKAINMEENIPEKIIIHVPEIVQPPALMKTIQFTPPKIVEDDFVGENQLIAQDELTDSNAQISVLTVPGVEGGIINIVDVRDQLVPVMAKTDPTIIHPYVEEPPLFPGGETELTRWLQSQLQYPAIASENGIQGKVTLRFVVEPDGSVAHVEVLGSLEPSCDREAVRVVSRMPKWKPGRQNGDPVRVYFTLPIFFRLDNSR